MSNEKNSMKIVVEFEDGSSVELTVAQDNTVKKVKEQISTIKLFGSLPLSLYYHECLLERDKKTLLDYEIRENSLIQCRVIITQETLQDQLAEILRVRELSQDELGLLYCYKYGTSLNTALQLVGVSSLEELTESRKDLIWADGNIRRIYFETIQDHGSHEGVAREVETMLRAHGGQLDITTLCSKFLRKFNVTISSLVNKKPIEFLASNPAFSIQGRGIVKLNRRPAPLNLKTPRENVNVIQPLRVKPHPLTRPITSEDGRLSDQEYLDLHSRIWSSEFNDRVVESIRDFTQTLVNHLFLKINEVVLGGSVAKGTSIDDNVDACVVFFVDGFSQSDTESWLPPLLKGTYSILEKLIDHFALNVTDLNVAETSVKMRLEDVVDFDIYFSPIFDSYGAAIQCLGEQGPEVRRYFTPVLMKQKVLFLYRQPLEIKITIRLLKWWRDRQAWSKESCRPTNDILEMIAVYIWLRTQPSDQRMAIGNCMSIFADFDQLRVVWTNFYSKEDIWERLLGERPLLMDPTSPFTNLADKSNFDHRELKDLASKTNFFGYQ